MLTPNAIETFHKWKSSLKFIIINKEVFKFFLQFLQPIYVMLSIAIKICFMLIDSYWRNMKVIIIDSYYERFEFQHKFRYLSRETTHKLCCFQSLEYSSFSCCNNNEETWNQATIFFFFGLRLLNIWQVYLLFQRNLEVELILR